MNPTAETKAPRPLSPHLQIYRPQLTSVLSIMHRLTGIALSFGLILMVAWLVAMASGPDAYNCFLGCARSLIGQIILFGLTVSFFYHLSCGIRHLLWDSGLFLDIPGTYKTGRYAVIATLILTALVWLKAYGVFL